MLVLLVNDDGIHEPGLLALEQALSGCETFTVAPMGHCSGAGMSLGLYAPLSVMPCGPGRYAVTGTPVDCVKIALAELLPRTPDLVISGINPGANLGNNIWYSGTVAAATEASFWNVPAIAISVERSGEPDFRHAAGLAGRMVDRGVHRAIPVGMTLNVNLPPGAPLGLKLTRPGSFQREVPFIRHPDGSFSYGPYELQGTRESGGTDVHAILSGYGSISVLRPAREAMPAPRELEDWCLTLF
jgi:5'-nucleotidase